MAFINDDQVGTAYDPVLKLDREPVKTKDHSVLDVVGAAFRTENTVGSAVMHIKEQWGSSRKRDVNFDPFEDDYMQGYEGYAKRFVHVKNKEHADSIKRSLDRENNDRQIIDDSDWGGTVAQVAAGILDPVTIAGFLVAPEVVVPGRIALSAGRMAAVGTADGVAREAVLNPTQETRTVEQSMFNIGAGAVLSGVLGAAAGKLTKPQFDKLLQDTTDHLAGKPPVAGNGQVSMGAAAVQDTKAMTTLEQEGATAGPLGKLRGKFVPPNISLANSPVKSVRETAQELGIDAIPRPKHFDDIASPNSAELDIMHRHNKATYSLHTQIEDQFVNVKKATNIDGNALTDELARVGVIADRAEVVANPTRFLNKENFNKLVAGANRNGDQSVVSQVANVARHTREIFNSVKDDAINVGLFPEDISAVGADSYLTRIWDVDKVRAGRTELKGVIQKWLKDSQNVVDYDAGLIADDFLNNLLKVNSGSNSALMQDALGAAGSLKAKTFAIPDNLVGDYIENDIQKIVDRYIKSMGADIALTKNFGSKNMKSRIDDIITEYDDLIEDTRTKMTDSGADSIKINKAIHKLEKDRIEDLANIRHMRDKVLGLADKPSDNDYMLARSAKVVRTLVAMKSLGGVTLSSIPDLARHVQVHGLRRTGKVIQALVKNAEIRKASKEEMKKMGVGLDLINSNTYKRNTELADDFGSETIFEKYVNKTSDMFAKVTLMPWWNAEMKQFAGIGTVDRVLEGVTKYGSLDATDRGFLAKLGIDEATAKIFAAQFKNHGDVVDGLHMSLIDDWTDRAAAEQFEKAILKASEIIINTPHAGTLPKFMNTWWGKTIMQFKSFAFTQYEQTVLAGLGARDSAFWHGTVLAVGLGAFTSELKSAIAGKEGSKNPTELLFNGIDSSGLLAIPMEVNNVVDKFGVPSFNDLLKIEGSRRYAEKGPVESLGGAWIGLLNGAAKGAQAVEGAVKGEKEIGEAAVTVSKQLPFQNIYGLRPYQFLYEQGKYFDRIHDNFDQTFGQSWDSDE